MNGPLAITPQALAEEVLKLQGKLGAALGTLREVDDVQYGATEREEVWRDGKVVLYRFRGENKPTAKVPLLISYALVNRPYMVDLQADRSIVKGLLARGADDRPRRRGNVRCSPRVRGSDRNGQGNPSR